MERTRRTRAEATGERGARGPEPGKGSNSVGRRRAEPTAPAQGAGPGVRAGAWEMDDGLASAMGFGDGERLPDDARERFEASLGTDLSEVRVHTDAGSAES